MKQKLITQRGQTVNGASCRVPGPFWSRWVRLIPFPATLRHPDWISGTFVSLLRGFVGRVHNETLYQPLRQVPLIACAIRRHVVYVTAAMLRPWIVPSQSS